MNNGPITFRESMPESRHVGVLVFDEAEVLDVAGPFEVFSIAGRRSGLQPFTVSLIGIRRDRSPCEAVSWLSPSTPSTRFLISMCC
jgi:transcriptional regulator GlxA family with amidase domain